MLPKITYPIFELILPSNKKKYNFRPFTVKEEKLLLIANESEDFKDKIRAIRQIVNNCMLDLNTDIGLLPAFDLEYSYLKIRAKSVGEEVELRYRDNTDNQVYDFTIDLNDIEVTFNEKHKSTIQLTDIIGIQMRYPTIEMLDTIQINKEDPASILSLVKACIATIYDEDSVYDTNEHTDQELSEFVESIPGKAFEKIIEFFDTIPVLKHDLVYTDQEGTEKTITLQGIDDFFQ
jgi:hypothetical protein